MPTAKESARIKELVTRRNQISKTLAKCKTCLTAQPNVENINEIKFRLTKLIKFIDDISNIQIELEVLEHKDDWDHDAFESDIYNVIAKAETFINANTESKPSPVVQNSANSMPLPTISIPKFSGNYENWLPFHDTFKSLVHENTALGNIQKFHHLKSALDGDAAKSIQHLDITGTNYETAWSILNKRFMNNRLIVQKHAEAILDLPSIQRNSASSTRHLLNCLTEHLAALNSLGEETGNWSTLLIYIITRKFDFHTRQAWESSLTDSKVPKFESLLEFLSQKCLLYESMSAPKQETNKTSNSRFPVKAASLLATQNNVVCVACNSPHRLYQCHKFRKMSIQQKYNLIKSNKLCRNCLRPGHQAEVCKMSNCKQCEKRHNTLLHDSAQSVSFNTQKQYSDPNEQPQSDSTSTAALISSHVSRDYQSQVILATASILVKNRDGQYQTARALLDPGSQACYVTEACVNRLNLLKSKTNVKITGINASVSHITQRTDINFKSRINSFSKTINCLITPKITESLPVASFEKTAVIIPPGIKLADPEFFKSKEIDLLIGAELYFNIITGEKINTSCNQPHIVKTQLGWIVCGRLLSYNYSSSSRLVSNLSTLQELNETMSNFWRIEECDTISTRTPDETECENYFKATTIRNKTGRFIVRLPFKENPSQLGNSRDQALKRFYSLENKLKRNPEQRKIYSDFMQEYELLGHMREIKDETANTSHYYLPHHAVIKNNSLTTKTRVVFDGSAKTSTGVSLNDLLHTGPQLQEDLFSILTRFRTYEFVITADIAKMYRQVLIATQDTPFQRILWRENNHEAVKTYELNTVTYGTRPGSFLAIRCLQELANSDGHDLAAAKEAVLRDFYVDDLITGANTYEDVMMIQNQITNLLRRGGFEIRKWSSNSARVLENIQQTEDEMHILSWKKNEIINSLGIQWNAKSDHIQYSVQERQQFNTITKRRILSHISKIFDPLGLLGPCVITLKILIQKLWQVKLGWDEAVPSYIQQAWLKGYQNLRAINELRIPRRAVISSKNELYLHGFCDASENAYGACIYLYTEDEKEQGSSSILCAKSKVAPLKCQTIPRLELCAALLLVKLTKKVLSSLKTKHIHCTYWTDSTIVLNWIATQSRSLKTFVSNRVARIQELTTVGEWRHVDTGSNPADIISRGIEGTELATSRLWWKGPTWLEDGPASWPNSIIKRENVPDKNEKSITLSTTVSKQQVFPFDKYSNLNKLRRVTAFCLRFINNCKHSVQKRQYGTLTHIELSNSLNILIKMVQKSAFAEEIIHIQHEKMIKRSSKLLPLSPFIDHDGVLRVGGRLKNSNLEFNQRHQILLPRDHNFTRLIVENAHIKSLHSGPQGTLAIIRNTYWIINGRTLIRKITRNCVKCFKASPKQLQPLMGELPAARTSPARPFSISGVDFCGPLLMKESKRRNAALRKIYVAIFICFSTTAVHIELVSDLTTEAFVAALKRFISRRGMVKHMHSDNATNFQGASKQLKRLHNLIRDHENQGLTDVLNDHGIEWHFIPPQAPNFGGLWESAVRAVKRHLRRTIGNSSLTYEELNTVLIQIEAVLNSRPLTSISEDPNDLNFLTPGHFLIGDSITAPVEPDITKLQENRLSKWQHLEKMRQHFWRRWSHEYLCQLQQRKRWRTASQQLQIGQLVLIQEPNQPPLCWPTGRIVDTHPGSDGIIRVATVRTNQGIYKRSVRQLCPFPNYSV